MEVDYNIREQEMDALKDQSNRNGWSVTGQSEKSWS